MILAILRTVALAVVTAGLVVLPCTVHAAQAPDRAAPLPSFEQAPSTLPAFHPIALNSSGWQGESIRPKRAPHILAPIGAFAAGTAVPTILFVQDAMSNYEPYRAAAGLHPAELQPRFHGSALVHSAVSVALAPAGAALFYMIGGGKVVRAFGGGLFGVVFAIIGVPMGALVALALTSPYQENPLVAPRTVYTVYALSLYGMTTSMSLAGFFLIGKKKRASTTASLGLAPVHLQKRVAWLPTLRVRF